MKHISPRHYFKRDKLHTIANNRPWNGLTDKEVIDRALMAVMKIGRFDRLAARYAQDSSSIL